MSVAPGGTLLVHNDFGRTIIRGWDGDRAKLRIRRMASDPNRLDKITVRTREGPEQTQVSVRFDDHGSESAYLEIHVPRSLGVLAWGTHSAIELYGLEGPVQAWTLSGLLTTEDVTSSVSLRSQNGDILFRTGTQPRGDIRLESFGGKITCQLSPGLDLRGWIRAGGTLSWNGVVELQNGSLQRNLGAGGPLLYANSLKGNVLCKVLRPETIRPRQERVSRAPDERQLPPVGVQRISHLQAPGKERDDSSPVPVGPPADVVFKTENPGDPESGQESAPNSSYSLKVLVNWVYLNVSVRDPRNNRRVSNLTREDFLVYEDDVLQTVEKFEPAEAPFRVLLLLDVSGSTRPHLDLLRRASADFSREIKTNDQIAVATFNSRSWLILPFTNDREKVRTAIDGIYSGGGTALYDALMESLTEYSDDSHARQAIVVFTDGVDNQLTGNHTEGSRTTFPQLFGEIRDSDSLIYPIFLDHRNNVGRRTRGLAGGLLQKIPRSRRPTISIKQQGQERPPTGAQAAFEHCRSDRRPVLFTPPDPGAGSHLLGDRRRPPGALSARLQGSPATAGPVLALGPGRDSRSSRLCDPYATGLLLPFGFELTGPRADPGQRSGKRRFAHSLPIGDGARVFPATPGPVLIRTIRYSSRQAS